MKKIKKFKVGDLVEVLWDHDLDLKPGEELIGKVGIVTEQSVETLTGDCDIFINDVYWCLPNEQLKKVENRVTRKK